MRSKREPENEPADGVRSGRFDLASVRPPDPPMPVDPPPAAADLPVPLAVMDRDMRFRWLNDALARALGFTVADLVGVSWYTVCPASVARKSLHQSWFLRDAGVAMLDAIELPASKGGPEFARVRVFPLRNAAGDVERALVVAADDTDRVTAKLELDRALHDSRERLDVALAGAQVGVWRLDLATSARTISLDENCARLAHFDTRAVNVSLEQWLAAVHRADRSTVEAWLGRTIAQPGAWHEVEYRHFVDRSRVQWLLLRGIAIEAEPPHVRPAVTGVVIDVGARKEAEQALRASEFRHRALARMLRGYVYEGRLTPQGTVDVVWADAKFHEIWGCDLDEFNRRGWLSFVHPRERAAARERGALARRGQPFDAETRVIDSQGRVRWLRVASEPMIDPDTGQVTGFIGMGEDITERKRLTESIREAALREQERIGRDLHDGLGQVLTGISFLVSSMQTALKRGHAPTGEELENVASLVRGAIDTSRTLARGLSPLRLDGGLAASLADLARHAREVYGLAATCRCPARLDLDASTAEHLYRIAQEALTNAARHAQATKLAIVVEEANDVLKLSIEDDGTGLPPAAGRRNGLGLRTMAHRAELVGGMLGIEAVHPRGTRIVCTLER
jgi:PAS domain S-box-containing protein